MAGQEQHNLVDGAGNRVNLHLKAGGLQIKACPGGNVQITDDQGNGLQIAPGGAVTVIGSGSLPAGTVSSVFGRTGAVAAQAGDYDVTEITGAAPLASPALTGTPTINGNSLVPASEVLEVTGQINSAQLLALHTTPVVLASAPGAGFGIWVDYAYFETLAGTVAYAGSGTVSLQAGTANMGAASQSAWGLNQTANNKSGYVPTNQTTGSAFTPSTLNNGALTLNCTANPTNGNGVMNYLIRYRLIPIA